VKGFSLRRGWRCLLVAMPAGGGVCWWRCLLFCRRTWDVCLAPRLPGIILADALPLRYRDLHRLLESANWPGQAQENLSPEVCMPSLA